MVERFVGKLNEKGEGTLSLLKEGHVVIETETAGATSGTVILSNNAYVCVGEVIFIDEKEVSTPAPKFLGFRKRR